MRTVGKVFPFVFFFLYIPFYLLASADSVIDHQMYNQCYQDAWLDGWELGYNFLCAIGFGGEHSYYIGRFFSIGLLLLLYFFVLRKFGWYVAMFSVLSLAFMMLGGHRQAFAIIFLFFSIYYSGAAGLLFFFAAMFFHYSSIYFILYYFVSRFRGRGNYYLFLLAGALGVLVYSGAIYSVLGYFIPSDNVSRYAGMLTWKTPDDSYYQLGHLWYLLYYGFFFGFLYRCERSPIESFVFLASFFVLLSTVFFSHILTARISLFVKPFEIFIFAKSGTRAKLFLFFMILVRFFISLANFFVFTYPYKTFLS